MAIAETQVYMPPAPRPRLRMLADERGLRTRAAGADHGADSRMFIAYPFVRGSLLSGTQYARGVPGASSASPLLQISMTEYSATPSTTPSSYGRDHRLQTALGLWLPLLLNRNFSGKAFTPCLNPVPFIIPGPCFRIRLEVDVRSDI